MKRIFLTSMSPDGKKPGELIEEVQFTDPGPQMYIEPVPYWSVNDAAIDKLKTQVASAESELRHAVSRNAQPLMIQRLESTLSSLRAELEAALYPRRQQRTRETGDGVTPSRQTLSELAEFVAAAVTTPEAPAGKKKKEATGTWDKYLKDLDERLAARALAKVLRGETIPSASAPTAPGANSCCSGRYLCPSCRAKAAAA